MDLGLRTIRQHWPIAFILAAFFALGVVYAVATPLFEKPDEIWHYPYVKYLADGQGLPVQDLARAQLLMKQESTQPPLYYVTAALATFWIEDDDWQDLVWLNPFWGYNAPGTVNDNKNRVLHTDRERFPYRGAVLAVRTARLVSVIWGTITVLATYLMALELFPRRRSFAAGAAALVAFNPQFVFISSAVSNDSTVSALCTLALWLMVRLVTVTASCSISRSHHSLDKKPTSAGRVGATWVEPVETKTYRGQAGNAESRSLGFDTLVSIRLWLLNPGRYSTGARSPGFAHDGLFLSRTGTGHWVLLGLVLGLALLAKTSALALLPVAMVAVAIVAWSEGSGWTFLRGCIILFCIVSIVAGWWYVLNWRLHGDPLGVQIHQEIVGPGRPELTLAQLIHEFSQMELSFWAAFGWGNVHVSPWIYTVLRIMAHLGALGLFLLAKSGNRETGKSGNQEPSLPIYQSTNLPVYQSTNTWLGLALLLLWSLLVFVALLRWLQWVFAPSGRHLFPAISSITILLLLGFLRLIPSRLRGKATALLAGAMLVFAIICPLAYIAPAYARPSLLSAKEIEAIPNRLDVDFGGVMQLLGYDLPISNTQYPTPNTLKPGDALTVTLYWQSLAKTNQDYAVFIHLLDENDLGSGSGLILAQRNSFPGLGSFPTTLWQAGDAIADTYTLTLPETTYTPSWAQLEVGLFDLATGDRLLVLGPEGEPSGDNVRFHEIEVLPRSQTGLPNPVHFNFGGKIALAGYEMARRKVSPGEAIHLTLYWQGLAEMEDNYTVFVHLLREQNQTWAGTDRQPQKGAAPTSSWSKGQTIVDQYELVTPPDAPPDVYEIEVGLYLPETGDRLDLLDQDGRSMGNRVLLSKVRVE